MTAEVADLQQVIGGRLALLVDVRDEIVVRVRAENHLRVVTEEVHLATERQQCHHRKVYYDYLTVRTCERVHACVCHYQQ